MWRKLPDGRVFYAAMDRLDCDQCVCNGRPGSIADDCHVGCCGGHFLQNLSPHDEYEGMEDIEVTGPRAIPHHEIIFNWEVLGHKGKLLRGDDAVYFASLAYPPSDQGHINGVRARRITNVQDG